MTPLSGRYDPIAPRLNFELLPCLDLEKAEAKAKEAPKNHGKYERAEGIERQ